MILFNLVFSKVLSVGEFSYVKNNTSNVTVYIIDSYSRADIQNKLISEHVPIIFDQGVARAQIVGQSFIANQKLSKCTSAYDSTCYTSIDQNTTDQATLEKIYDEINVRTEATIGTIVYTSDQVIDVQTFQRNYFSTGLLWTTIIIIFILFGYFLLSACPSLLVEEPMDLPKGEDEK